MSRVFRCKTDLGLWACDGRTVGNEVRQIYCRLHSQENDASLGYSVTWQGAGVQPYVAEAGDWCGCNARCGVGNTSVFVGEERRAVRPSMAEKLYKAARKIPPAAPSGTCGA